MNIDCCRFGVQIEIDVSPNKLRRVVVVAIAPLKTTIRFLWTDFYFYELMTFLTYIRIVYIKKFKLL